MSIEAVREGRRKPLSLLQLFKETKMRTAGSVSRLQALVAAVFCAVTLLTLCPAVAQINCAALPQWSATAPPVNQVHIFCGEWNGGPKGFHSRPGGLNPATVTNFTVNQPANTQGIYSGIWEYVGHPGVTKFSTMFPDACSQSQVLQSILYAAAHPIACPAGAPFWAWCGNNAPLGGGGIYCNSANGTVFVIAGASLANGNVNTAFPLM